MKGISFTYNGTGAAVYLCVGFIPDRVEIYSVEDADMARAVWQRNFRAAEAVDGYQLNTYSGAGASYTAGQACREYRGGDLLTSANQTSTTYGEGVYLGFDEIKDYRFGARDAVSDDINAWTLDTAANRTGHFNEDVTGTYIGEGSLVTIRETSTGNINKYLIEALTATQGEAANEVTLRYAAPSGDVLRISGMYDMKPLALASVTPAGIYLAATSVINVNDEIQVVNMIQFDDLKL